MSGKISIQFFNRRKARGQRRVDLHAAREIREQRAHPFHAPLFDQPLHDER